MPEEPVIVSGGSVTIEFNDSKFKDDTPATGKKRKKHSGGRLRRIMVNDQKVADLKDNDRVEIIYED
jgi:hypothetical protein